MAGLCALTFWWYAEIPSPHSQCSLVPIPSYHILSYLILCCPVSPNLSLIPCQILSQFIPFPPFLSSSHLICPHLTSPHLTNLI